MGGDELAAGRPPPTRVDKIARQDLERARRESLNRWAPADFSARTDRPRQPRQRRADRDRCDLFRSPIRSAHHRWTATSAALIAAPLARATASLCSSKTEPSDIRRGDARDRGAEPHRAREAPLRQTMASYTPRQLRPPLPLLGSAQEAAPLGGRLRILHEITGSPRLQPPPRPRPTSRSMPRRARPRCVHRRGLLAWQKVPRNVIGALLVAHAAPPSAKPTAPSPRPAPPTMKASV